MDVRGARLGWAVWLGRCRFGGVSWLLLPLCSLVWVLPRWLLLLGGVWSGRRWLLARVAGGCGCRSGRSLVWSWLLGSLAPPPPLPSPLPGLAGVAARSWFGGSRGRSGASRFRLLLRAVVRLLPRRCCLPLLPGLVDWCRVVLRGCPVLL